MGAAQHGVGRLPVTLAEPIVLPADVVLVPVADLPEETRSVLEHADGDFAVTRPRTRTTSSIVDGATAGLLERFRDPKTIVDAIVEYSRAADLDPNETLERAFPMLAGFINSGMLVPADSELAAPIGPTLEPGERVGAFTVVEAVHVIDDTEVHLAHAGDGSLVALKVARAGARLTELRRLFDREAAVLAGLSGTVTPRLVERSSADGRELLAVEWCSGVDALEAASELRETGDTPGLLALAERVIAAYAQLHGEGVLHGDVHPRNVVVDRDGSVRLIDFGLAARDGDAAPRGGIDLFLEPELALARLAGHGAPPLSSAGEQYSVASLVYLLVTGAHTHAFSLEEERMLHQLAEDPPLPFAAHGAGEVARVEEVLARALEKDPAARFASLDAFRAGFAATCAGTSRERRRGRRPQAGALLADVVERLRGPLAEAELEPPTASVNLGAAGLAYGALRIALARDDAELLSLAERWSHRALVESARPEAFENAELQIGPERNGAASLFHSVVGVHCVEALVAAARGDELARALATERFIDAVRAPSVHLDVAFGAAGALLGCAQLLETTPGAEDVVAAGDALDDALLDALGDTPLQGGAHPALGAAHGWSGFLHASLRWSEGNGRPARSGVAERVEELASLGVPAGRGLRFPRESGLPSGENALAASWCNGAAGHIHLWLTASRVLGEPRFERIAEQTAWTAYDADDAGGDLCCGAAGRAYALLAVHRHVGGAWLDRAGALAERAALAVRRGALRRDSLYKGDVGVAVLAAELGRPEWAALPLYEREGTPERKESP